MNLLAQEKKTFLRMGGKEMLVTLSLSLSYCGSLVGMLFKTLAPIPGFSPAQNVWFHFVLAYQPSAAFLTLLLAGFLGLRRSMEFNLRPVGAFRRNNAYLLTRPISRRFYFWGQYGIGSLQTILLPITGTLVMYLLVCATAYPHYGWVGGMGAVAPVPPAGGHELERYQMAMSMLTPGPVKLMLVGIGVGLLCFSLTLSVTVATGRVLAGLGAFLAGDWFLLFVLTDDDWGRRWTSPGACAGYALFGIVVLAVGQRAFVRRDL